MTALARYARLESEGRYFDGESPMPRPVYVSFGERSLVIADQRTGRAAEHWPLASLRAVDAVEPDRVELSPDLDSEARLALIDPDMIAAIRAVCPNLAKRRADRRGVRAALVWGAGAVAALAVTTLVILPNLAEQAAPLIPPAKERALGDAVLTQVQRALEFGDGAANLCEDPAGRAALDTMAARIGAAAPEGIELRIDVMDHPLVNAFALPGGRVVLFRGLIDKAEGPEEIAGVLAHEVGHVIHRDPTTSALRVAGTAGLFSVLAGDVAGAAVIAAIGEQALNASYSREAERRADDEALRMLNEAELPTKPFADFFVRIAEGQSGLDETPLRYLLSHPGMALRAERAAAADRIGDRPFEPVLDDDAWVALQNMCGERNEADPEPEADGAAED